MFGNYSATYPVPEPDTMACQFRRYGYQTGLFGKSHMIRRWDEDGFEKIRYVDLCDALPNDPTSVHYFKYLVDQGLVDYYGEGIPKKGQRGPLDGSAPAYLPYKNSLECYTGDETVRFLQERDPTRPFFIQMSFERPHSPITPAKEYFDMYDPKKLTLPESACDYFKNNFAGKPQFMIDHVTAHGAYPMAKDEATLRRCLASYYALISCMDMEIGRVIDLLEKSGELENTIIFYNADHGDFAGEHGLFHKNFGIYESIQRIPFLLAWPGGPKGQRFDGIVESVDLYPTLCELTGVPLPKGRDGTSVLSLMNSGGKEAAFCEWDGALGKTSAIRTKDFRLVFYPKLGVGELYDRRKDPGEIKNLWNDPSYATERLRLTQQLLAFVLNYSTKTGSKSDEAYHEQNRFSFTQQLHKGSKYYSHLMRAYEEESVWPPESGQSTNALKGLKSGDSK
jgi:arylsulfatase A-like enzyme